MYYSLLEASAEECLPTRTGHFNIILEYKARETVHVPRSDRDL